MSKDPRRQRDDEAQYATEFDPRRHRLYGFPRPEFNMKRAMGRVLDRLMRGGLETWDSPEVAKVAERDRLHLKFGPKVLAKRKEMNDGKISRAEFVAWCRHLHDTEGYVVDFCFSCGEPWHEWTEYDEWGTPVCPRFGGSDSVKPETQEVA